MSRFPDHNSRLVRTAILGVLTLVLFAACSDSTRVANVTASTPEELFSSILGLSKDQRYDEIRPFVIPINEEEMRDAGYRDSQDLAIEMIRDQAYPENGDMAYSDAGLEALIEHHLDKFSTMPARFHEPLREYPYASNSDIQETLKNDPDGFSLMSYAGVNVIIVRVRGSYRLLFWEHLPRLAEVQQD